MLGINSHLPVADWLLYLFVQQRLDTELIQFCRNFIMLPLLLYFLQEVMV